MSMTAARWKELGCSLHSPHGSASDMAACIGPHAPADVAMTESDEQELGHWERLDSPAAIEARTGPAPRSAQGAMRVRYTSGATRAGHRAAQLRVSDRWKRAVRQGLARFGASGADWTQPRGDRSDYDILVNLGPSASGE